MKVSAAVTLLLLAFVSAASSQELDDYVDKEAIAESAEDFKGNIIHLLLVIAIWRVGISRTSFVETQLRSLTVGIISR